MDKKDNLRNTEIKNLVLMIIVTLLIGVATFVFYISRDKSQYINYNENSDIDYKVYLKENEFYREDYQEKNKGYIASLIDTISARFKYKIDFSEDINYKYSYRIAVEVDVKDSRNNSNIYHFSEDLITKQLSKNSGDLKIDEMLSINYQEYNDLISRFKDVYELKNTEATLNAYLYVNIQDIDKSNTSSLMEKRVSSLEIPLTENTVSIDIGNDTITNDNNRMEITRAANYSWVLLIGLFYILISAVYIVYLFIYSMRTRTAQMIYDKEIRSIMNNYDSYIQKINGSSYDIGTSQVLKIETFNDMLEIRDTLKQPILMLENEEKNGTFFIIPATNSIIYTYALRVVDIRAKMEGKEVPTYDITEIPQENFVKNKKYTDKYIQDQITMTTAMPVVDEKNVIKGNKDSEKDLYDQLEKTSSFDINEIKKAEKEQKKKEKVQQKKTKKTSKKEKKTKEKTNTKKATAKKTVKKAGNKTKKEPTKKTK